MKFKSDIEVQAGLKDSSGAIGTSGQLLSSTATGVSWTSLNGFVPYTGAIQNVDLGIYTLLAAKGVFSSSGSANTVEIGHSSGSGIALNITKGGNGEGLYVNKTSGSGNAVTIIGTLNATTLVKSGGTAAQILAADGTVITAGTNITISGGTISADASGYLPLSGGTMTGNINWAQTDRGLTWGFNTDGASIKFYNTGDGDTNSRLEFATLDNSDEYFRWGHVPSGGSFYESMRLRPIANGSAQLIVSGNLGLGVTPTSWGSQAKVLQLNAQSLIAGMTFSSGNNQTLIGNNVYVSEDTNFRYIASNPSGMYRISNDGSMQWFVAPLGTAGNPITFNQAMTLDTNGRLAIGTNSFAGDELLMVSINGTTNTQAINIKDRNASANASTFMVFRKSDDTFLGNIRRSGTSDALYIGGNSFLALGHSGNTEAMRIFSNGNVLIQDGGTFTNAGFRLDVNGSARISTLDIASQVGLSVSGYGFLSQTISGQMSILGHNVRASSNVANQVNVVNGGWISSMIKQYYNEGITFHTSPTFFSAGAVYPMNTTERMRITSDGNVGIGTINANQRLVINQGVTGFNQGIPATAGTSQNGILRLRPAATLFGETFDFGMNVAPTYAWIQSTNADGLNTNYPVSINPNGGSVLIGTTTDNGNRLQVNGNLSVQNSRLGSGFRTSGRAEFFLNSAGADNVSEIFFGHGNGYIENNIRWGISDRGTTQGELIFYVGPANNSGAFTTAFTLASSRAATFASTVTATGFFNSSDIRLKQLTPYNYSVSDIKPISYFWKDGRDDKKHIGYSAQEVQKVMPDAVNEGTDGILSVNYIEVLVAKIAELENRIKQLEK